VTLWKWLSRALINSSDKTGKGRGSGLL